MNITCHLGREDPRSFDLQQPAGFGRHGCIEWLQGPGKGGHIVVTHTGPTVWEGGDFCSMPDLAVTLPEGFRPQLPSMLTPEQEERCEEIDRLLAEDSAREDSDELWREREEMNVWRFTGARKVTEHADGSTTWCLVGPHIPVAIHGEHVRRAARAAKTGSSYSMPTGHELEGGMSLSWHIVSEHEILDPLPSLDDPRVRPLLDFCGASKTTRIADPIAREEREILMADATSFDGRHPLNIGEWMVAFSLARNDEKAPCLWGPWHLCDIRGADANQSTTGGSYNLLLSMMARAIMRQDHASYQWSLSAMRAKATRHVVLGEGRYRGFIRYEKATGEFGGDFTKPARSHCWSSDLQLAAHVSGCPVIRRAANVALEQAKQPNTWKRSAGVRKADRPAQALYAAYLCTGDEGVRAAAEALIGDVMGQVAPHEAWFPNELLRKDLLRKEQRRKDWVTAGDPRGNRPPYIPAHVTPRLTMQTLYTFARWTDLGVGLRWVERIREMIHYGLSNYVAADPAGGWRVRVAYQWDPDSQTAIDLKWHPTRSAGVLPAAHWLASQDDPQCQSWRPLVGLLWRATFHALSEGKPNFYNRQFGPQSSKSFAEALEGLHPDICADILAWDPRAFTDPA